MRRRAPLILVALASAAIAFAGCGGDNGDGDGDGGNGSADLGRQVFTSIAQPTCASCHTLADAGSTGTVGPDLDELQPSRDQVVQAVTNGAGIMPPFGGQLSEDEIDAVAGYVSGAASG